MSKLTVVIVTLALVGYASAGIFGGNKVSCGSSTSSKSISLVNPTLPPRTCNYKIDAYSSSVCQLRIDFAISFAQPTVPSAKNRLDYTECRTDYLEVGGYRFCGQETDQHIYIPLNRTGGEKSVPIKIVTAVRAGGSNLPPVSWDVHVEQLECAKGFSALRSLPVAERASSDGYWVAPTGCLQYYPESSGTVKSFNFDDGEGAYPGKLSYAICFRREADTEGIELEFDDFQLGFNSGIEAEIGDSCRPVSDSLGLNEDRLLIPDAEVEDEDINANLFCGSSLSGKTVVSKTPGPIVLVFHSDDLYNPEVPERGFSFDYNLL